MVAGLVVSNEPGFLMSSIPCMHALTRGGGLAQDGGRGLGADSQGGSLEPPSQAWLWEARPVTQPLWSPSLQLSPEDREPFLGLWED